MEEAFDLYAITVDEALTKINKWLVGVDNLWGQGYGFDYTILEDMYRCAGKSFLGTSRIIHCPHCLVCATRSLKIQKRFTQCISRCILPNQPIQTAYKELGVLR